MYFKKIELQGFKSFAEPVTIEFQEGITCIVGPNGSGKSNISDAIRWVLGEQSPKALRGGKMEEVIFSGTATRKPKGMAEVTLVIDNSAAILPIDFSEVAIRRRMYRSGESEYSINGTSCRLKDIRELIMDTGIGVDGYSIISQGRISEIVNSRSENRRELFEEAAGVTRYKARKAESERKLETAGLNLSRVDDIIDEIESRIDGLKEDSRKAAEYLTLRERYKELEINITLKNIENLQIKNEYIKDDLIEAESRIQEMREEEVALDAEAAAARSKNETLDAKAEDARARLMENVSRTNEIAGKVRLNEERKLTFERDKKRLQEESEMLSARLAKEKAGLGELESAATLADGRLREIRSRYEESAGKMARQAEMLGLLAKEIDEKKLRVFEMHRDIAAKESELSGALGMRAAMDRRVEQLRGEMESASQDAHGTKTDIEEASEREEAARNENERLTEAYKRAETAYAAASARADELSGSAQQKRLLIEQLSARKRTIEEMESNYEGYNQGVREVMKSGITGLLGVAAELMETPKGFELALETALGPATQNIICEDEACARMAIDFLKKRRAGRLTFLPLRDLKTSRGHRDEGLCSAKGSLGYAVDRIKFRPELRPVFEYLLGRVLIADTLDNAVNMSKKARGIRFVTLEGDVINSAGAMTGGAHRNKSANLLERRREIVELAKTLKILEEERAAINDELTEAQESKSANLADMQSADLRIRENEALRAAIERDVANLKAKMGEISTRMTRWEAEIEGIAKEQARSVESAETLESGIREAQKAEMEAETALDEMMGRYDLEKATADRFSEEVTAIRMETAAAESEKQSGDRMLERVRESIAEIMRDKESRDNELASALAMESELLSGDVDLEALLAEKEKEKRSLEIELSIIQENKSKLARMADEQGKLRTEIKAKLEGEQSRKYETEIRKAKNDALLDSMKDRLWAEFELSYIQAAEFKKKEFVMNSAVRESREIKNRLKELGEVNVGAIKEYETVSERHELLTSQRADILSAIGSLKRIIEDTDKNITESFKKSFEKVEANFSETFSLLFGGGKGELRLVDEANPLECDIEINAQPPGKKLQNMNLLSGGEKTMTAIALMFSILRAKPTPFCILDEVEAALDDSNINRFAEYLRNFKETQFTLVTHQKATMEYADALYGVTMPEEGITKVLSLKLGEPEASEFARALQ
ncbi:MAG: chromosome segregation protein SMC [Clostridiales Family XIII bacterium]|nr:chromosome segregation protein SMC [Clostridiales Family XIII bacterium]